MSQPLLKSEVALWEIAPIQNAFHLFFTVSLALCIVFYYYRRKYFPLRGRGTDAILSCCTIYLIVLISSCARGPGYPCVVDLIIFCVGSHCACACYLYRVVILLVKNDIAKEIQLGASSPTLRSRSCLHNRRLIPFLKFRGWIILVALYGLLIGIGFFTLAVVLGDKFSCKGTVGFYSNVLLVIVALPVMSVLSFKLRKYPSDGRKISVEFRSMAICIIIALIAQIILSQSELLFTSTYVFDFVAIGFMATSLLFPIKMSFSYANRVRRRTSSTSVSNSSKGKMDELLQKEDFREAFLLHLKGEFSAESLVFWEAVTTFKEKGERTPEEMAANVQELLDLYVVPTAPYLLNTSLDSIRHTQALFDAAKMSGSGFLVVFDVLLAEVVELMKRDPLPRFLRSPGGREFSVTGLGMSPSTHGDNSSRRLVSMQDSRDPSIKRHSALVLDVGHSSRRPSLSGDPASMVVLP